ncbi:MAG TPA: hypothetical protein VMY43_11525 [Methanothrix sp.]|nr:hypothetical protein [Methanothrix sp.]
MPLVKRKHKRSEIQNRIKQFFGKVEELPSPDIPEGVDPVRLSELIGKNNVFINSSEPVSQTIILDTMKAEGFDPTEVYAELVLMRRDGEIFEPRKGVLRIP